MSLLFAASFPCGCGSAHDPPARPASAAAGDAQAPTTGFRDGFGVVEARGHGLEFPLPDPGGWRRDKRERHSWVALHANSSSQLVVRAWQFHDAARPEDCEREARLSRPELPLFAASELIESRPQLLAGAYRGNVTVGVRAVPAAAAERLHGHVLAFASDARRCLLLAYSTAADGRGARQVLAARLASVAGSVFERVRTLDIEGRVDVPRP